MGMAPAYFLSYFVCQSAGDPSNEFNRRFQGDSKEERRGSSSDVNLWHGKFGHSRKNNKTIEH